MIFPHENLKNFKDAGKKILEYLHNHLGFSLWMITRTEGNDWIILQTEDHGYGVKSGQVFNWDDSYCSQMVLGNGPRIAPDSEEIPVYAKAGINKFVDIKAYIGQPLFNEDGSLFGTLCAIDPLPQPQSIESASDLLELFSLLLSRILQNELKLNEQKRVSEKFQMDSLTDHLTGIFNRRAWDNLLDLEENRCKIYGHPTTIIIIDLNDLKYVNDKFGHSEGDRIIQKTAQILKKSVRTGDLVARLGGDEFGILNIETNLENTQKLANRILESFQKVGINAAIGIAVREPDKSLQQTLIEADKQMYKNKLKIKSGFVDNECNE